MDTHIHMSSYSLCFFMFLLNLSSTSFPYLRILEITNFFSLILSLFSSHKLKASFLIHLLHFFPHSLHFIIRTMLKCNNIVHSMFREIFILVKPNKHMKLQIKDNLRLKRLGYAEGALRQIIVTKRLNI